MKHTNKRLYLICLTTVLFAVIFTGCQKKNVVKVGFYNIDEPTAIIIQEIVNNNNATTYIFRDLSEKEILNKKISKKIDILITPNGALTQNLKEKAIPLSSDILQRTPQTIKTSSLYQSAEKTVLMPIVIDEFETAFLRTLSSRYGISEPDSLEDFDAFCEAVKLYYAIPMLITGSEDININSLFTQLILSLGGKEAYHNIADQLINTKDFSLIYDYKLNPKEDNSYKISDVLNILKNWQNKGFLPQNWTTMNPQISYNMVEDNRSGLIFMNLSEHRTRPMPMVSHFSAVEFPRTAGKDAYSLQPVYVGMCFKDVEGTRLVMNRLSLPSAQEQLSVTSQLGPGMLQGTPCDVQADDARFLAAITKCGPAPDLGTFCFVKTEDQNKLAQAIRAYFN